MKNGQTVSIIHSIALSEMKLDDLVGRTATVVEIAYNKNNTIRGCWVELDGEPFHDEIEWYIPLCAFVEINIE